MTSPACTHDGEIQVSYDKSTKRWLENCRRCGREVSVKAAPGRALPLQRPQKPRQPSKGSDRHAAAPQRSGEVTSPINEVNLQFLLNYADRALTFVKEAETTVEEPQRQQAAEKALRAYRDISAKRPRFSFANLEARVLDIKLEHIRSRLKRIGPKVDPGE
jgi:hypothetical protein